MTIRELRQNRAGLIAQARALVDAADTATRTMTDDENTQYTRIMADVDRMRTQIEQRERLEDEERELGTSVGRRAGGRENPDEDDDGDDDATGLASPAYRAAFRSYVANGRNNMRGEELRALQADVSSSGGFLYAPLELIQGLLTSLNNDVFVRRLATRYQVTDSESLGIPTLTNDISDAIWTTELATGDEDNAMAFGRRDFKPIPLAKRIKESKKLLRKLPDSDQIVMDRMSYKFEVAMENGYLTGTGVNQPLGLFTASANGIPTTRDVSSGNTATAITFDGLLAAKYALKAGHQAKSQWAFSRAAIEQIARIKDSTGNYIWKVDTRGGEPDMLLGRPVNMSEYIPNTFATGLYVGILGNFSYYWIVDSLQMEIERLTELYAETNQIGFIGRLESDGMPVLAEAFARVKLA